MSDSTFAEALNEQIGHEFAAHQQYVAIAVFYDAETLPQLAAFFYRQAIEERNHAMMITQYMLDADLTVQSPGVAAPESDFDDIVAPVAQEKRVTEQISALAAKARNEGDYQGEQFMQWFIKEQTEEVSTMTDLLRVVDRAQESPLQIEEYLARESLGEEGDDPTAPRAAGGAL